MGAIPGATDPALHRPVTIVFSDLKGSTALAERLDPESLRALLSRYFDEMGLVFGAHGGTITKIIGDAIVAVFDGLDDPALAARHATSAAVEAVATLERLNDSFEASWGVRIQNRTGVATGELVAGGLSSREGAVQNTDAEVLAGEVVGIAETLESNAPTMEVLVDRRTLELVGTAITVEAMGAVPRKGAPGTVDAWRVDSVAADEGLAPLGSGSTALPASGTSRDSRRTVTIVFADPRPDTDRNALAPEVVHALMERYFATMRPILERHGGTVEKFIGDALMAVFGLPVRHEDDAARAVRAAHEMRAALPALNDELVAAYGVRLSCPIGVNTGNVVAGDAALGQRLVTGDAVNVAARLEQVAADGDVVLGDITRQLVGDLAVCDALTPLVLKGKSEPVPAHRLVSISTSGAAHVRHTLPLVGRAAELDALRATFATVVHEGRGARTTLVGDAGVGKSRLTHEFLDGLAGEADVLSGNCLAYGDGITFWPLLRVVQGAAGIEEDDDADTARARLAVLVAEEDVRERLAALAGLSSTLYAVPELVWAMRCLLEQRARANPVVVLLDDVHWAEPTLLETVDELTATVGGAVMFLCTSRPALPDEHQQFVDAAPVVRLSPLTDAQCDEFLRMLLGGSDVDDTAIARISDAAGGNPLFLEQLLRMLIDVGRLQQHDDRWRVVGDLATLQIPASIEALLAARIDRLPTDSRQVLEPASVIGRRFAHDALTHLVEEPQRSSVDDALDELQLRELIEPDGDELASRFQHQMIRDATYNGLLKDTRATLHERFVMWADAINVERDRANEFEEIQGYHLEQAFRYWRELGTLDEHALEVGESASKRLASAGGRALGRGDMRAAANLLVRAADLLPDEHRDKPRTLLAAGNALHETGAFDAAIDSYEASAAAALLAGDATAAEAARVERVRLQYLIGRVQDPEQVEAEARRSLAVLQAAGEPDALSRAWQLRLNVDIAACRWAAAHHAADEVIGHARRAGNRVLEVRTMPLLAFLAQKGPMPVVEAAHTCESILERVSFDRRSTALTQLELALLSAMALDLEHARHLYADTRRVLGDLGWEMQAALVSLSSGPIELLAEDPKRAEDELRRDFEALERLDERNFISLTSALLADAVYRQGRLDEARTLVDHSLALAAPDDLAVQIIAGCVAAKVAARGGDVERGLELASEAVTQIDDTEDPSGQADARLDLAEVQFLAGARDPALATTLAAAERYERKGNRLGLARAARVADAIGAGTDPR
jgi:class 3 adenylate cyclase/tetratricopeptide (TPR) repeat protein